MSEVKVIIPVHEIGEEESKLLKKAIESVEKNVQNCSEVVRLTTAIVCPPEISEKMSEFGIDVIVNDSGYTDFCSQVNFAAKSISDEYFSILEFDDEYSSKWFRAFERYRACNAAVSLFLPVVTKNMVQTNEWSFANELPLSSSFSNEIGFVDLDSLENFVDFNITGGIFNRNDFLAVGGLKKSMKVSFSYEFMLRLANKKMGIFVVPKEGYLHRLGRKNSLLDIYMKSISPEDARKWYQLAKRECRYENDRNKDITTLAGEQLK